MHSYISSIVLVNIVIVKTLLLNDELLVLFIYNTFQMKNCARTSDGLKGRRAVQRLCSMAITVFDKK